MAKGFLKVKGDRVVDGDGNDIVLRGTTIGGWMNMDMFSLFSVLKPYPNIQSTKPHNWLSWS